MVWSVVICFSCSPFPCGRVRGLIYEAVPGRPLLCSRLIQRSRDNIGGHGQFLVGQRARIEQEGMILKASDQGRNGFEQALLEAFRRASRGYGAHER